MLSLILDLGLTLQRFITGAPSPMSNCLSRAGGTNGLIMRAGGANGCIGRAGS